jgi:hypothetical protein
MPTIRPRIGGAFNSSALKIRSITADLDRGRCGGAADEIPRVAGEATNNSSVETKVSLQSPPDAKTKCAGLDAKTAGETEAEAAAGRVSACKCETPCTARSDGKSWCWLNQSCAGQPGTLKSTTGYYWRRCDPSRIASNAKVTNGMVLDAYRALRVQADRLLTAPNISPLLRDSLLAVQGGLNGRIAQLEAYFGPANVGMNPLAIQLRNSIVQADASADVIRDVNAAQIALSDLSSQVAGLSRSLGILGSGSGTAIAMKAQITAGELLNVYEDMGQRITKLANSNRLSNADRSKLQVLWKWAGDRYDALNQYLSQSNATSVPVPTNVFGDADRAMATLIDIEQRTSASAAVNPFVAPPYPKSSYREPSEELFEAASSSYPSTFSTFPQTAKAYPEPVAFTSPEAIAFDSSSFDSQLLSADEVASVWPEYAPPPLTLGML